MSVINKITEALVNFRNERDWKQFHNVKDLAIAINVEASELLQLFLWKEAQEPKDEKIKEELADVLAFAFLLAHEKGFDIEEIILNKLKINTEKYPIEKAKGNAKKYNEL
jgi:NTP pyrophosphatase (non-canonical NTP hydrolase)